MNNLNSSSPNLKKGFFNRVLDYIKTRKYERKMLVNEKYKTNWDKIKWKYRTIKFSFILGFYFVGKYLYFDNVLDKSKLIQIKSELQEMYDGVLNMDEKIDKDVFDKLIKDLNISMGNLFDFTIIDFSDKEMLKSKEIQMIIQIISSFSEKSEKLINLEKLLKIVSISKKYTKEELTDDFDPRMVDFIEYLINLLTF